LKLRLQAQHATRTLGAGTLRGVFGVQAERLDFSALGDEAFVPDTRTRSQALFVLEEWRLPAFSLSAGARIERVRVASAGDAPGSSELRFGPPGERHFSPTSASVGVSWPLSRQLTLSANLGATERAPTYYELYANGVHVATGAFEVGNPALSTERSTHAELGLQWRGAQSLVKAQVFATRFARYIALDATGGNVDVIDDEGATESFPEFVFRAVPARLTGFEVEARTRLVEAPWAVELSSVLDAVRANNRASGEPLPRIPPLRLRVGLEATQGAWTVGVAMRHQARQSRVPATDVATPGATLVDASVSWRQRRAAADALVFLRLDNVGDRLAYNAAALRAARELSPLPRRSATLGLRVNW
jgi:iron complex outermembrane receptor protein